MSGGEPSWTPTIVPCASRSVGLEAEKSSRPETGSSISFDGPARGIRCATAISEAARALGIEVRAGLHTGECERRGDDLGGLAVHIAARVNALAAPSEVLVTSTVKDLVVGSGIQFTEQGEHSLRGVPETWKLFSVVG